MPIEHSLIAFVATASPEKARAFYESVLGLTLVLGLGSCGGDTPRDDNTGQDTGGIENPNSG